MTDFSKDFEKYLNLYLDNMLDAETSAEFEQFLQDNPEMAVELEALKDIDSSAKSESLPELPEGYWEGLNSRIDTKISKINSEKLGLWARFSKYLHEHLFGFVPAARIASITLAILTVALISRNFIGDFHVTDMVEPPTAVKEAVRDEADKQSLYSEPEETSKEEAVEMHDGFADTESETAGESAIGDIKMEKKAVEGDAGKSISVASVEESQPLMVIPEPIPDSIFQKEKSDVSDRIASAGAPSEKLKKSDKGGFDDLSANARSADSLAKVVIKKDQSASNKGKQVGGDPWSGDRSDTAVLPQPDSYQPTTHRSEIVLDEIQLIQQPKMKDHADSEDEKLYDDILTYSYTPFDVDVTVFKIRGPREMELKTPEPLQIDFEGIRLFRFVHDDNISIDPNDLELEDFPVLNWSGKDADQPSIAYSTEALNTYTPTVRFDSQEVILLHELDSLIAVYNADYVPGSKIAYYREIVDRAFELTRMKSTEDNLRKFKIMLGRGVGLGIITPQKYEEYNKALPLLDNDE